jgi:hypothetical protein
VLLFLIKSSPDSEETKKIKNPAVKQLVNIRMSAVTSRFIETISIGPFENFLKDGICFEKLNPLSNINSLFYNIIESNRTGK